MTRALLDTDTLSFCLKGIQPAADRAKEYLRHYGKLDFSTISYYEVRRGLVHVGASRRLADLEALTDVSNLWELGRRAASQAADICAALWRKGEPLEDADILIAAIARSNGLALATNNEAHFSRVPGLVTENWLA